MRKDIYEDANTEVQIKHKWV